MYRHKDCSLDESNIKNNRTYITKKEGADGSSEKRGINKKQQQQLKSN